MLTAMLRFMLATAALLSAGSAEAQTTAVGAVDAAAELKALSVRYGPRHPRVVAVQAELARLTSEAPALDDGDRLFLTARIARLETELARLSETYGPRHPRIREARARLGVYRAAAGPSP